MATTVYDDDEAPVEQDVEPVTDDLIMLLEEIEDHFRYPADDE